MPVEPDVRDELRELLQAARAYLEFERACGSPGVQLIARAAPEPDSGVLRNARPQPPTQLQNDPLPAIASRPVPPAPPAPAIASTPAAVPPPPEAALALEERVRRLDVLAREAETCRACVLHEKRTRSVFARGAPTAELAFVGEGPGRDEDLQGYPFVGAAGQLLDKMIVAMGYGRDDVYVCNVVKCRPPENRTPRPEESLACARFLVPQLELVNPKYIVALGRCAAQALGVAEVSGPWRGRWGAWRGVPVMPTYHPAFLLRSPEFKRTVWEDLQLVMGRLGKNPKRAQT